MTTTVYLDTNIYRYIALGELEITTIGDVIFTYSSALFDDIYHNSENKIALEGVKQLGAVEVRSNEEGTYEIDDIGVYFSYVDPFAAYENYAQNENEIFGLLETLMEPLLAVLGADNQQELANMSDELKAILEDMIPDVNGNETLSNNLKKEADRVTKELKEAIDGFEQPPKLTDSRTDLGFKSGASGEIDSNDSGAILKIWEKIENKLGDLSEQGSREDFFGLPAGSCDFEKRTEIIPKCYLVLNMLGYFPDSGLTDRSKLRKNIADAFHVLHGSLCNQFLTSDKRQYLKAKAIFEYKGYSTKTTRIVHDSNGMRIVVIDPNSIRHFSNR